MRVPTCSEFKGNTGASVAPGWKRQKPSLQRQVPDRLINPLQREEKGKPRPQQTSYSEVLTFSIA